MYIQGTPSVPFLYFIFSMIQMVRQAQCGNNECDTVTIVVDYRQDSSKEAFIKLLAEASIEPKEKCLFFQQGSNL